MNGAAFALVVIAVLGFGAWWRFRPLKQLTPAQIAADAERARWDLMTTAGWDNIIKTTQPTGRLSDGR
jgi:hypothetical protein